MVGVGCCSRMFVYVMVSWSWVCEIIIDVGSFCMIVRSVVIFDCFGRFVLFCLIRLMVCVGLFVVSVWLMVLCR